MSCISRLLRPKEAEARDRTEAAGPVITSNRGRAGGAAARFLDFAVMVGVFFFARQFLQGAHGFSPLQAGLGSGALATSGIARTRKDDAAAASGLVNVAHQMSLAFGLALLVAVTALAKGDGTPTQDFVRACHEVLIAGAALLILAFMLAWTLIPRERAGQAVARHRGHS